MQNVQFDHEKLKVYQEALKFIEWLSEKKKVHKLRNPVNGQLDRAAESIVLNIAEGNGRFTPADKCRFFDISRGSALESAAALDILVAEGKLSKDDIIKGKNCLKNIIAMLIGLIKSKSDRVYDVDENYSIENEYE